MYFRRVTVDVRGLVGAWLGRVAVRRIRRKHIGFSRVAKPEEELSFRRLSFVYGVDELPVRF